jgi:hypothetical protein
MRSRDSQRVIGGTSGRGQDRSRQSTAADGQLGAAGTGGRLAGPAVLVTGEVSADAFCVVIARSWWTNSTGTNIAPTRLPGSPDQSIDPAEVAAKNSPVASAGVVIVARHIDGRP